MGAASVFRRNCWMLVSFAVGHVMNRGPIGRPRSVWLAAFVALFVGLGAQVLLGSIIPVDFGDWSISAANDGAHIHAVPADSLWISGTIIRFLSFAIAGIVAVLSLGALTGRLLGALLVVAVLATFLSSFQVGQTWS